MKKLLRYIFGIILILVGLGLLGLSIYLFFHAAHISILGLIGMFLVGVLVTLAGFAITTGESIRKIIELLLLSS